MPATCVWLASWPSTFPGSQDILQQAVFWQPLEANTLSSFQLTLPCSSLLALHYSQGTHLTSTPKLHALLFPPCAVFQPSQVGL